MNASPRTRQVAAVMLVVFLLTTVWAAYYLYSQTRPASGASGTTTVATYAEAGANDFAAAVLPSELYNNSSEVYGGNVTLFTPITTWINVSMLYVLTTNRTAAISLAEAFAVNLSTSAWSKTLFTSTNATTSPATSTAVLGTRYDINVTEVVALADSIGLQVGYPSVEYTLSLLPRISGSVTVDGAQQAIASVPGVSFNFSGSLVRPSGLSYRESGALTVPSPSAAPPPSRGVVAVVALVASVAGVGGSTYVATRRPEDEVVPPLSQLLVPYEEAVAETGALPAGALVVPVAQFSDLVKVADTLGKPILRPTLGPTEPAELVVLDGEIAYRYRHPASGPLASRVDRSAPLGPGSLGSGPAARPGPSPATPPKAAAPPTTATSSGIAASAEAAWAAAPPSKGVTFTQRLLLDRLRVEARRLGELRLDPWIRSVATDLAQRSADLLRSNELAEAAKAIDGLSRLLTDAAGPSPAASKRGREGR